MKTKIIKLHTPELREDLKYDKYCVSEELSFRLRETPLDVDIDKEIELIRNYEISQSVSGKIISTSSRIIYDQINFVPIEEVTVNYE
jgi:hypothetical protein